MTAEEIPKHVVTGDARCVHHNGFNHLERKICCGGREMVFAVINCSVLGQVVVGKKPCDYICKSYRKS